MQKLFRDDRGSAAIQYALIIGVIGVGIVASLTTMTGFFTGLAGDQMPGIAGAIGNMGHLVCGNAQANLPGFIGSCLP